MICTTQGELGHVGDGKAGKKCLDAPGNLICLMRQQPRPLSIDQLGQLEG